MQIINTTYSDPIHGQQHIVVSSPFGGGGSFQVLINDYFRGQVVCTSKGWIAYIKSDVLTQDDIDGILDVIRRVYPCG